MSTQRDFWTVDYEGKTYTVTHNAYIGDYQDGIYLYKDVFLALAVDSGGKEYRMIWEAKPGAWERQKAEEDIGMDDMCDWDHPTIIKPLQKSNS